MSARGAQINMDPEDRASDAQVNPIAAATQSGPFSLPSATGTGTDEAQLAAVRLDLAAALKGLRDGTVTEDEAVAVLERWRSEGEQRLLSELTAPKENSPMETVRHLA
eukprot:SAG31_NODE_7850_length_1583_cov_1.460916_2_plen_108_part_00